MAHQDTNVSVTNEGALLPTNDLLMVRLLTGAVIIGTLVGETEDGNVGLTDPLLYNAVPSQGGKLQVHLDPVTVPGCEHPDDINRTFTLNPTNFMWVDTVSASLAEAYEGAWKQLRAAASGIVLAKAGDLGRFK